MKRSRVVASKQNPKVDENEEPSIDHLNTNEETSEESDVQFKDDRGKNYGFKRMKSPPRQMGEEEDGEENEEEVEGEEKETEEMKELKAKIQQLICRYPTLTPRTSSEVMDKLDEMNERELRNVYTNCVNDVADLRGTPAACFVIFALSYLPNKYLLPFYTEVCLEDTELKHDVEAEIIHLLGALSTRINIVFRMLNNTYVAYQKQLLQDAFNFNPEMNYKAFKQTQDEENSRKQGVIEEVLQKDKERGSKDSGKEGGSNQPHPYQDAFS